MEDLQGTVVSDPALAHAEAQRLFGAPPVDEEAAAREAMARAMNGGDAPDHSASYANERTIADARLDRKEGNLVYDADAGLQAGRE